MNEKEFKYDSKYKFTETWFDHNIPLWDELFKKVNHPLKNVLEIGCFEGRATVYLCSEVLEAGTNYDVIDTFGGSEVEGGMGDVVERLKDNPDVIYNNFTHNIKYHKNINFNITRDSSQYTLPEFSKQGKKYDLIFIDASHRGDDTFVDAYWAHKMLNLGGILIFDDFGWIDRDQEELVVTRPELGIKTFITMYDHLYDRVHIGYQVILRRHSHTTFKV